MAYFQDPVSEIIDLYAYQARQERIARAAQSIGPQQAATISSYARNTPWMPAGVSLSLGRAGIPPSDVRVEQISNLTAAVADSFRFALASNEAQTMGIDVQPQQLTRGRVGAIGAGMGRALGQKSAQNREELGYKPMTQILREHPELRSVIMANSVAMNEKLDLPERKMNTSSRKGIAFNRILDAFQEAGVPLPFYNNNGTSGVFNYTDEGKLDATLIQDRNPDPEQEDQGGGAFSQLAGTGSGLNLGPVQDLGRSSRPTTASDAQMQEGLRQAGIPIDPDNPFSATAGFIRPGLMALDAPTQELQGQFRNVVGAARGEDVDFFETQSDLGISLTGQGMDATSAGTGFFVDPESQVAQERRRRESERGLIGGHNITIGRFLADTVTEPDTKPFLLLSGVADAGVQLADPSTYAVGKLGELRTTRNLFEAADEIHEAAGLVNGIRRTIRGDKAATWLNGSDGIKAIEALTGESSAYRIWVASNRKLDPAMAQRFADASITDETRGILETALGPHIRTKTEINAVTKNLGRDFSTDPVIAGLNRLNPRVSQSRMLRWMPKGQLDTMDPKAFATQLERHMVNAKVPVELQEEVFNEIARSQTRGGLLSAATKAMEHEKGILVQGGMSPEKARQMTSLFRDNYESDVSSFIDEIGDDVPVWTKILSDGSETAVPGPHLVLEHLNRYVPLPDARDLRRLTSNKGLRFLTTTQGPEAFGKNRFPIAMMDFLTQEVWKTGTLLGRFPAWVTRVVGESQLRMAAGGLSGALNHPIDYFAYAIGKRGAMDPLGVAVEDLEEFRGSLSAGNEWLARPGVVASSRPVAIAKTPEFEGRFMDAWADELSELHHDPVSKMLLRKGEAETERWLMVSDEGKKHLKFLQESHPGNMKTSREIREYLQSIARRQQIKTGGNTELLDALGTGKLGDVPLIHMTNRVNPKFRKALEAHFDSAPDVVKGYDVSFKRAGSKFYDRYTRAVDRMFSMTMGFADNLWDRAPVFKQYLWQHTAELLPYADATSKARIVANAERAGLSDRMLKGIYRAARRGAKVNPDEALSIEELTHLARGYAADSAKKMLYDLNEKGQLADAMRIIAPFGNAYQEIFGAWGKLLNDIGGPGTTGKLIGMTKLLRRGQQVIEGARGEDFGSLVGAPAGEGFFFKDERGEEVFVIPGSQAVTSALSGVPVPLTGSVKGLNMIGNMIPGLGPVAAIPVAKMIQDKPAFQGLNDLLLPYGAPGDKNAADALNWMTYAPPWVRTAFNAATDGGYDQRTWANAQKDTMAYLYSTGNYDTTTRAGMNHLLDDAKRKAHDLYYIKAFAQVFAPTSPSFRFLAEDKSGTLLSITALTEEFFQLQEVDYENAAQLFMKQYGENAILAVIPKSSASTYGIARTKEQKLFLLQHPELQRNFPSTYGLFLPQDGEFDYDTYIESFREGDREDLSPGQWLNLANATRGDYLYNHYKDRVGERTDPAAREYLRQARQMITEAYPSGPTGVPEKPDTDQLIEEMYKALDNPTIANTDAGKGLALYLQYRDRALAYATQIPGRTGFSRSKDTENVRVWLNGAAQEIINRHPAFQFMWDIVLSRETHVEEDELDDQSPELEGAVSAGR